MVRSVPAGRSSLISAPSPVPGPGFTNPDSGHRRGGWRIRREQPEFRAARYLGSIRPYRLKLDVYWRAHHSRTLAYRNAGNLVAGDYVVICVPAGRCR